jgi:predicted lipoprotein with Yx(FWY)xxD motif
MLGDGAGNNAWRVALDRIAMPPGITLRSIYLGRVLADARGRTLYWQRDQNSVCDDGCPDTWMPLYAPWLAQPQGDWTLLARRDGQRQWAFRGRRLYLHADDLKPGDTAGLTEGDQWQVAILHAAPALPGWVTVQNSDMGEVFADARGHTLYTLAGQLDKVKQLMCDDACIRRYWRTIPAAAGSGPAGDWTAVASPAGGAGLVWAYKGNVLYTHTRDREPGAIGGDKWAAGVGGAGGGWVPLLRRRDFDD